MLIQGHWTQHFIMLHCHHRRFWQEWGTWESCTQVS